MGCFKAHVEGAEAGKNLHYRRDGGIERPPKEIMMKDKSWCLCKYLSYYGIFITDGAKDHSHASLPMSTSASFLRSGMSNIFMFFTEMLYEGPGSRVPNAYLLFLS